MTAGPSSKKACGIDKELWRRVGPVVDELVDATEHVRNARLNELRVSDPEAAKEIVALLEGQAAAAAAGFLDGIAVARPDGAMESRRVGSYTLERPIGRGGMGTVWLAHRSDGRYESKVAFKFVNATVLDRGGAVRFEREGRALARLSHPNIARLLDAGIDGDRPYLVLEHVEGQPLDRWCDEQGLDVAARIRVFLDVLAAVAHAHANLILHRDIKPSNILVTAAGTPKLLDFGIAKLMDDPTDPSPIAEATFEGSRAFTPAFAAPEQPQGAPVTMATDVYALGVLLYILLVGRHPTLVESGSHADHLRALSDVEPPRLSRSAARTSAAAAQQRAGTPRQLSRALRGDLDTVVAKALRKVPSERYPTVAALADDLRRFLNHEPVTARTDSLGYRTAKFVRRHRIGVASAAMIALTLAVGVVGTLWQAREAARQRDAALEQLDRAETARAFIEQMLLSTWGVDERISRAEFLARSEQLALRGLEQQPEQRSVVLQALATFYASLGDFGQARPLSQRAVDLLPSTADRSWRASAECQLALDDWMTQKSDAAQTALERWASDARIDPGVAATCASNLAKIALNQNDVAVALAQASRAQRLVQAARRPEAAILASIHGDLGYALALDGKVEDAEREFRIALDIYTRLDRAGSPNALAILNNWSTANVNAGDVKQALRLFDEVIRLSRLNSAGLDPPPYVLGNRAAALLALGRYQEAIAQADEAGRVAAKAQSRAFQASALLTKAGADIEQDEFVRARQWLAEAEVLTRSLPPDNSIVLIVNLRRARLAIRERRWKDAAELVRPVITVFEARQLRTSALAIALRIRAESAARLDDPAGARRDAERALAITRELQGPRPFSLQSGLSWLLTARLRHEAGDIAGAREAGAEAERHLAEMLGRDHGDTRQARALAAG